MNLVDKILILTGICLLCPACWLVGEPKNSGRRDGADTTRPREGPGGKDDIGFPVGTSGEKVILELHMNEDNTVLTIKGKQPGEKLFVLASLDGTVFRKTDGHVGLQSSEDDLRLNFDLGQNSRVYQPDGQTVEKGDHIAETTGDIKFYIEEDGKKVPLCLNVDGEVPDYVDLKIFKSEKSCP